MANSDYEEGEWEPFSINNANEPIRITTSIDPHLDLVVDEDKRVDITLKCLENYENALNAHRIIEFVKTKCARRLEKMEKEHEDELEEIYEKHKKRKIKVCGDSQKHIDFIKKVTKYESLRVNRLLCAAKKIGEFKTASAKSLCTLCQEDILEDSMCLALHSCNNVFHLKDKCISILLSKTTCPNCRQPFKINVE